MSKTKQQVNEVNVLLEKFKIRTTRVIVKNKAGVPIKVLTLGGNEVIFSITDDKDIIKMKKLVGNMPYQEIDESKQPVFYKYVETPFNPDKLKELLVHKSTDSYSKEDALKLNKDIKSKEELEDNIVYITDKQPMTNTLALAKQFDLGHRNVIIKLYELGSMYPSVLMQMKYDVYKDDVKSGGMKSKPKNSEPVIPAEYSAGIKSRKSYQSFIHISEDIYYQFIKKISTPKGITSSDETKYREALAKLTHIESKQDEYFNAFKRVRDFLLESGTSSKEIEAMMRKRTNCTSELMSEIYNYVIRHNSYEDSKKLNVINVNKLIFNIVNYINNINAVNYVPPTEEELKENFNRKTKDESLQEALFGIENKLSAGLKLGAGYRLPLRKILTQVLDLGEEDIVKMLKEYHAEKLWEETM